MKKQYNFYKLFIVFLLTAFSIHIFIIDLKIQDISIARINNPFYKFCLSLFLSTERFDVIWLISFIFIYYFFYKNYFTNKNWNKTKLIACIISIVISISIIVITSLHEYNNLSMIYRQPVQVFKCIMVCIGYYLIIYIFVRNTINNLINRKKKEHDG